MKSFFKVVVFLVSFSPVLASMDVQEDAFSNLAWPDSTVSKDEFLRDPKWCFLREDCEERQSGPVRRKEDPNSYLNRKRVLHFRQESKGPYLDMQSDTAGYIARERGKAINKKIQRRLLTPEHVKRKYGSSPEKVERYFETERNNKLRAVGRIIEFTPEGEWTEQELFAFSLPRDIAQIEADLTMDEEEKHRAKMCAFETELNYVRKNGLPSDRLKNEHYFFVRTYKFLKDFLTRFNQADMQQKNALIEQLSTYHNNLIVDVLKQYLKTVEQHQGADLNDPDILYPLLTQELIDQFIDLVPAYMDYIIAEDTIDALKEEIHREFAEKAEKMRQAAQAEQEATIASLS